MKGKKALVIINIGTPDKPQKKEVRKYLSAFLGDQRVIDIPYIFQKILVHGIIIPFRVGKSTKLYQQLWTENGSPLLYYLNRLGDKLSKKLAGEYEVFKAMRYGNPSLSGLLQQLKQKPFEEILFFPLFPQYASSTTGSIAELVFKTIKSWETLPTIRLINQFYHHPAFIHAFAERIKQYHPRQYDHILFSYHGLPNRHINKVHAEMNISDCACEKGLPTEETTLCYKAACYTTTHLLAEALQLDKEKYSMAFQSRLSKNWLSPFTDEEVVALARKGMKKILVVSPAFVADCLETIIELEYEYKELFLEHGGETFTLVHSLNDSDMWVEAIAEIIHTY